jgi:catechol 2,3-dioxygenase-like lactoylglutathione lyase family enzyme
MPAFILAASPLVAFAPMRDPARSRHFYESVLGLPLLADELPFALVFQAPGVTLRVTLVESLTPQPFTILGWQVADIESTVAALTLAGVEFLRYPGMNDTGPSPAWSSPSGAKVAWFHDPDRNVLSLTQPPPASA